MKKIHINYAALGTNHNYNHPNGGYFNAQMLNSSTAKTVAGFDESINYKIESLPEDFKTKHYQHFSHTRGAGYWIWKPYIILNHLKNKMNDNDLLMYTDSGCHFINNLNPLFNRLNDTQEKVLVFNLAQIEKDWTKRDCFIKLNCELGQSGVRLFAGGTSNRATRIDFFVFIIIY
jgi:hypothetical protein